MKYLGMGVHGKATVFCQVPNRCRRGARRETKVWGWTCCFSLRGSSRSPRDTCLRSGRRSGLSPHDRCCGSPLVGGRQPRRRSRRGLRRRGREHVVRPSAPARRQVALWLRATDRAAERCVDRRLGATYLPPARDSPAYRAAHPGYLSDELTAAGRALRACGRLFPSSRSRLASWRLRIDPVSATVRFSQTFVSSGGVAAGSGRPAAGRASS
jgi:hypothetical protein